MHQSVFKRISYGDIRGYLREDIALLLPPSFFEDPISFAQEMGAEVIKKSKLRWAAILTLSSGERLFFKRDRTKGWFESLKFLLLPSKARKEWFIAYQLQKKKLNIPQPLGWMEKVHRGLVKESYYLSEAIGLGVSLTDDSNQLRDETITAGLAKTVKVIHDTGLFHKDLHAGNFLWDGESFLLTDLHRAKIIRSLSLNQRLWNLSQLFHSLRSEWGERERILFIEKYFEKEAVHLAKKEILLQKVNSLMGRLQKRQWQSRTKRCLKESTEFSIQKKRGILCYHRRDYPLDHLKQVIEVHRSLIREKPSALAKQSPDVTVSLLNDGRGRVGVKQFHYSYFWDNFRDLFRPSKGLRSWVAGNGLIARGVPALRPLALLEQRNGWGWREDFVVMEAPEKGLEMDRYILRGFGGFGKKRMFIKHFAQWLAHLHAKNLYHRDMKACNILVSDHRERWEFHLLDLEDIRLNSKVDDKRLFKNLLQLNTSIPKTITRTDRLRFLKEYTHHQPVIGPVTRYDRHFVYRLMKKSRERGVVYVSPQGVVEER